MNNKIPSKLKEVPETMLWTLHNRATEALRKDSIIKDDKSIEIYQSIDYDYQKSFGKADPSHAVRSILFDKEIEKFLKKNPDATIVNLGEGLETQRYRIQEEKALWISVDLPDGIEIREQFIKPTQRHLHISLSVLDRTWFDFVPKDKPVFITAQGLFMYFPEKEVQSMINDMFLTFKEGFLMFDTIPKWISNKTMSKEGWRKTKHYTTPKMPWGINGNNLNTIKDWSTKIVELEKISFKFPRGIYKWVNKLFISVPTLKNHIPTIVKLTFKK